MSAAVPIGKLPRTLSPQLAKLTDQVPEGPWIAENKFDGYRLLARIEGDRCRLLTRNGNDWTDKLKSLAEAVEGLGLVDAWLDGEIVVLDANGVPNFNALQNAIDSSHSSDITYFVFDLPFVGDTDLRAVPLRSRRQVLQALMKERVNDRVRFSETLDAEASQLLNAACQLGVEGLILKHAEAPYVSERSDTWLKLKCQQRQEFIVVGFTVRSGTTNAVGGLLLAVHEGGQLQYAGNVGTGFDSTTARELFERLKRLETDEPSVDRSSVKPGRWSRRTAGSERWVRPEMIVEVAFAEWTPDKHVRHGTFKGVRSDKPAQDITVERASSPAKRTKAKTAAPVVVTHPDRVIDPSSGFRKVDLVRYYESVADWMLPHLAQRPVSLVRAPQGVTGQLFFQKRPETRVPGLGQLDPSLWPGY
nr:DNA ligase D [uncultured Pseudacidovorax sp.]